MKINDMEMIDSLDKLQRQDHDTLVKLNSNFENFLSRYNDDMKELKDGTTLRLNDLDARVRIIERTHEKTNPEKSFTRFEAMESDYKDFKKMWKIAQAVVIFLAALFGFIMKAIIDYLQITGK